jgi:hypothetical protein
LDEYQLAGVAVAARRLASWATAAELGAVAQLPARAAGADCGIGLRADGRPGRLCRGAAGQVSLALMLTGHAATAWAGLAITLAWRLPDPGAALAAGAIDLARARVIAGATAVLGQDAARAAEATVLPGAGRQATAQPPVYRSSSQTPTGQRYGRPPLAGLRPMDTASPWYGLNGR